MDKIKEAKEFLERNEHLFRQVLWDQLEKKPISDQSTLHVTPDKDGNTTLMVDGFAEGNSIDLLRTDIQRLLSIGLDDIIIDNDIVLLFDFHSLKPYVRRFRQRTVPNTNPNPLTHKGGED